MLAAKGERLYGKYCGTDGRGICAESFALYHIGVGEPAVAADLLDYLRGRLAELLHDDPQGRLPMTRGLVARIDRHLTDAAARGVDGAKPPTDGPALRRFVIDGRDG